MNVNEQQTVSLLLFVSKCNVGKSLLFIYIHIMCYYYSTLHLDTNNSKVTACSNTWYECKWTTETIQHYT
jgi:hypothetical protein